MATIPGRVKAGSETDSTKAQQAVDTINSLRDVLAQTTGTWPFVAAVVSGAKVAPWASTGATITSGAALRLDTSGAAQVDLDVIDPAGLLDLSDANASRLLLLRITDASRTVRLRHAQGSSGALILPGGQPWTLTSPEQVVLAMWDPAASPKSWRVLGALASPAEPLFAVPVVSQSWTTAGRPTAPAVGRRGLNTELGTEEYWTGAAWQPIKAGAAYETTFALQDGAIAYADLTHGLGAVPGIVRATLECLVAEHGYAVGDELDAASVRTDGGGVCIALSASGTKIKITQKVRPRVIRRDSPNNDAVATIGSWRWRVRAWR
jgi:hypothetical protein